ncbi:hypothetical protein [Fulvivirga lutimaris]|uniref:hypothetical protein n=1 Tax=Fulvivirga lutimaris TaxID=1819566 RepID=UPI0012BD65C7|nr:hypothetical protein [Fulvivirga lutimaris]MTI38464.1 hypothetical protein [Fulvivirga lutimaris]
MDRFALAKKIGAKPEIVCNQCGKSDKYDLNDIKATKNRTLGLIASLIFLVGTGLTVYVVLTEIFELANIYAISGLVGFIGIPYLIYEAINSSEQSKVAYFNAKIYG